MKKTLLNRSFVILTAFTLAIFAVGGAVAQGDKHGGRDHGDKHGGGDNEGNRGDGGGKHGDRERGDDHGERRGNEGRGNGDRGQRNVYIQPQQIPDGNYGRPDNYGQQRSAEVHERNAERKAAKDQWKQQRDYDRQAQSQQQYQQQQYQQQQQLWQQQEQARRQQESWQRQQQQYQQQPQYQYEPQYQQRVYRQPQYGQPQYRSQRQQQSQPQYQPSYEYGQPYAQPYGGGGYAPQYSQNYGYDPNYDPNVYSGQTQRFSAKDFLRNLIMAVLGSNAGYDTGYDPDYTASNNGMYAPAAYRPSGSGYYGGYPQNSGNTYDPYQSSYFNHAPQYDDQYYSDPNSTVFPVAYFTQSAPGGGFVRELFSQLMAVGYDQGFNDGLTARSMGRRNASYDDPYTYDNSVYDPYSVSLGENRRCLSQGYSLGYEDALRNNSSGMNTFRNGDVDFLSVLISSASQLL